jgi:glycosyltransferase involved in cell wall biosynthesis
VIIRPLYITSDFLPNHSGGTVRAIKHTKYFKKAGVETVVFTQQLANLPPVETLNDIKIVRSKPFNVGLLYTRLKKALFPKPPGTPKPNTVNAVAGLAKKGRLADLVFLPDIDIVWALVGIPKAITAVRQNGIQVILSSGPSHANHILALLLIKRFKQLKWVAEFRDPWITNPFRDKKWPIFEQMDRWLEKVVIQRADAIIVTSEKYKLDFLKRYSSINEAKISYVPNGYDSEDFAFLKGLKKTTNPLFTIISTGNYYQKRSLLPFLQAINQLLQRNPDLKDKFLFVSYGKLDVAAQNYIESNPMAQVKLKGYIAHHDCIREMYKADALLLIPGPGDGTMPGKTFEYLAARSPILALVDEGPSKELVETMHAGLVVPTEDIEQIVAALERLIKVGFELQSEENSRQLLKQYDRAELAHQVISTLKVVCS